MEPQWKTNQQPVDQLCDLCKSIDFDNAFSPDCDSGLEMEYDPPDDTANNDVQYPPKGTVPLAKYERLQPLTCALCRLLEVYSAGDSFQAVNKWYLCSIPWRPDGKEVELSENSRMLTLLPDSHMGYPSTISFFFETRGYIAELVEASPPLSADQDRIGPRVVDPRTIQYDLLRHWLHECQQQHSHTNSCTPTPVDPAWPISFIDCKTRLLVDATSLQRPCPPFVALSYVWGNAAVSVEAGESKSWSEYHRQPLQDLPRTIEDSITVTAEIGFRYLWVDKYCIDQQNEQAKKVQVRLMDKIYGSAQVTIIAAAGSDPTYGLPGVRPERTRSKTMLSCVRLPGGRTLTILHGQNAASRDTTQKDIASSKWASRGWTYQEGILSTRRLVFTDREVFLECGEAAFHEAWNIPARTRRELPSKLTVLSQVKGKQIGTGIGDLITEFTRRELGWESDILNALQGVFGEFCSTSANLALQGIPLMMAEYVSGPPCPARLFLAALCWTLERPGRRRSGFPSWSWCGWKGVVRAGYVRENPATPELELRHGPPSSIRWGQLEDDDENVLAFESADGTTISWLQLQDDLMTGRCLDCPQTLVLTCKRAFALDTRSCGFIGGLSTSATRQDYEMNSSFLKVGDLPCSLRFLPDVGDEKTSCPLLEGHLWAIPIDLGHGLIYAIVLQEQTATFWERVGHIRWPASPGSFDRAFKNVQTLTKVFRIA